VHDTVSAAGAMLDIFPSLHTAYPTLLTLYSLRYRHTLPFRYTAPVTAFFTANIIIATLFLRWHYAVDVLAGLLLAVLAQRLGILSADRETDEARAGRQPVWERLSLFAR
jgi:membrane-associated phospholipid phosphatase